MKGRVWKGDERRRKKKNDKSKRLNDFKGNCICKVVYCFFLKGRKGRYWRKQIRNKGRREKKFRIKLEFRRRKIRKRR